MLDPAFFGASNSSLGGLVAASSPRSSGGQQQIQHTIRSEMRQVLSEMSEKSARIAGEGGKEHRGGGGALGISGVHTGSKPNSEVQLLTERIATLEDVLAKSEADRCAVYARHDAVARALNQANEDRTAMFHEFHDNTMSAEQISAGRQELDGVRAQTRQMLEHYEAQIAGLNDELYAKDRVIHKLKKTAKQREEKDTSDGVSLADLQLSNERLSAQLAKLTAPHEQMQREIINLERSKVEAVESAVTSLNSELVALEQRLQQQVSGQAHERHNLQEQLEMQSREYENERLECDRVFGVVNAKLEGLVSENNFLRSQLTTLQETMKRQAENNNNNNKHDDTTGRPTTNIIGSHHSANRTRTTRRLYH